MKNFGRSTSRTSTFPSFSDPFEKGIKRHIMGIIMMAVVSFGSMISLIVGGYMSYQAQSWDALVTAALVVGGFLVLGVITFILMGINMMKMKP